MIGLSAPGYYAITERQALPPKLDNTQLALKAAFMASGQTYGSHRLVRTLNNQGFVIGRYRVRTLMKAAQLVPVWKRKFVRTTDSKHTGRIAPNLLRQDFKVRKMNAVWVADISYIRTQSGWLYLAAVMERFFLNLKMERVWQTHYANHTDAVKDISQYIVAFLQWH